jgi:hypothetical protein
MLVCPAIECGVRSLVLAFQALWVLALAAPGFEDSRSLLSTKKLLSACRHVFESRLLRELR